MSKTIDIKISVTYNDAIVKAYPDSDDPIENLRSDLLEGIKRVIEEGLFCNHPDPQGISDQLAMEIIESSSVEIDGWLMWEETIDG